MDLISHLGLLKTGSGDSLSHGASTSFSNPKGEDVEKVSGSFLHDGYVMGGSLLGEYLDLVMKMIFTKATKVMY